MAIVILRTGDAIPEVAVSRGEFSRWIRDAVAGAWDGEWREHDVRSDAPLPCLDGVAAFVVTGSNSSVTERAPWMLRTEAFIRRIHEARVPLLGICFGHQLIAQALGGEVQKNPRGREVGTVRVRSTHGVGSLARDAWLFDGLGAEFEANATHVDSVVRLPVGAAVVCATDKDPHAAYRVGETTWGLQFHPEIDGELMRGYINARADVIAREGMCPAAISASVHDAPDGTRILKNFMKSLRGRRMPSRAPPRAA